MKKNITSTLRQIITLQQPILIDDNLGEHLEQWQDLVTVRAQVQALYDKASGEAFMAMQLINNSFYRFRIRFMPELKNNMRIKYNDRYFQIKRIINQDELNMVSEIIAQENL